MLDQILNKILQPKSDFIRLFLQSERKALFGEKNKYIIQLTTILFITFLAIGFSIGSLNYLKEKMDNPYTNWVNLDIKSEYDAKVGSLTDKIDANSTEFNELYNLDNVSGYVRFSVEIKDVDNNSNDYMGRTVGKDSKLLNYILSGNQGNVLHKSKSLENDDEEYDLNGIIVTKEMLEKLGIENITQQFKLPVVFWETIIYVDILGVVEQLPNECDFICFSNFYKNFRQPLYKTLFTDDSERNDFYFISNASPDSVRTLTKQHFQEKQLEIFIKEDSIKVSSSFSPKKYRVMFYDNHYYPDTLKTFVEEIQKKIASVEFFMPVDKEGEEDIIEEPYYLAFNFNELIKIRDFNEDVLKTEFDMKLEMSQVETKENFAFTSLLTLIISIVLFGFSLFSIISFVIRILQSHLESIKMNLGTLTAFGLSNKILINTYIRLILFFLSLASLLGIGFAFLIGEVLKILGRLMEMRGGEFSNEVDYFDLFNHWFFIAFTLLFIICYLFSRQTIKNNLNKTPGNLIYNR